MAVILCFVGSIRYGRSEEYGCANSLLSKLAQICAIVDDRIATAEVRMLGVPCVSSHRPRFSLQNSPHRTPCHTQTVQVPS